MNWATIGAGQHFASLAVLDDPTVAPDHATIFSPVDIHNPFLARFHLVEPQTLTEFGVRFCQTDGVMTDRIIIPVRDATGHIVGYAGRACNGKAPLYRYSEGFDRHSELYNLDRALRFVGTRFSESEVIVVSDFFDCMKVHQACFESVVALMGQSLSETQRQLLVDNFGLITLLLDGDFRNRAAAGRIASQLSRHAYVHVVDIPNGKTLLDLSSSEIRALLLR